MPAIDPQFNKFLRPFLSLSFLVLEDGKKHARVRNTISNDWLPIPGSSSDRRALKNFQVDLHRLISNGHGFIYAKTGRVANF